MRQSDDATHRSQRAPAARPALEPLPPKIRYVTHEGQGLAQMQQFFGVRVEDLVWSGGKGWAVEEIHAITHTGTHVDAPYHYGPLSEGKPARRIDEVPLEWCYAPGVILDVRSLQPARRSRWTSCGRRWSGSVTPCNRSISCSCRPAATSGFSPRSISPNPAWAATARSGWWSRACASSASTLTRWTGRLPA